MTTQQKHADTPDNGHGYWKDGKWCQSKKTKQANRVALAERITYRPITGREDVCDE